MNSTMEYRGYVGSVEFSENDGVLFGKVQGVRSLISCEETTVAELVADFHGVVDDYLALCEEEGTEPEAAYKGSFNTSTSVSAVNAISAQRSNQSLQRRKVHLCWWTVFMLDNGYSQ